MEPSMTRILRKLAILPVLLLAVTACEKEADPIAAVAPSGEIDPLLGGLLGGSPPAGWVLANDPALTLGGIVKAVSTSQLISFGGGSISLLGHTLVVPAGAVTKPTLFLMTVLPTGKVEVDLLASVNTLFGILDVGSKGFAKPIPVTLTYSRSTNVGSHAPELKVLRIKSLLGYGNYEVMPSTVDTTNKNVHTALDHFSRYSLAYPAD
jgi:hypothetical protein